MRSHETDINVAHKRSTEYITTLEEEIATRDGTISSMQEEMTSLKTENNTLRTDLEQLKKTVDELLNQARPTPMPLASSSTNHSNVLTPNLDKDKSGFASSFGPGGHHALGSLNVHTLFLPEPSPAAFAATAARRNINPRLNSLHPTQEDKAHLPGHSEDESFFGSNPYLLNGDHLDQYRASLYSKLTHNINGGKSNDLTHFQPSYFTSPAASSDPLKALSASQTSLPLSPTRTDGDVEQEVHSAVQAQTARVASLASTSLLTNMFRIFVNTFVGAEPAHVSDLLAGRATLQVAPSASSSQLDRLESRRSSLADVDTVERDLAALKVDDSRIATRRS